MGSMHPFGVGTSALHHFAASTPVVEEPGIGYGSPLERFKDDIIKDPIPFDNGVATVIDAPGLGVEIDENKLKKYGAIITIK